MSAEEPREKQGTSLVLVMMAVAVACVLIVFGIAVWDMTHPVSPPAMTPPTTPSVGP